MDYDVLLSAHEIVLMKANATNDCDTRLQHLKDAAVISGMISCLKAARREDAVVSLPAPSIRAGVKPHEAVVEWENEGGALAAHSLPNAIDDKVPPIVVTASVEFAVGPYRYSNSTDALSRQARIARLVSARGDHV